MNDTTRIDITSLSALTQFAQAFVQACSADAWVYLLGDLGTGKTTFSQHFLRAKGYENAVTSPTYALMNDYNTPTGAVVHCDLYRLSDPEELYEIGLLDLPTPTIKLIEWAKKGAGVLPAPDVELHFSLEHDKRWLTVTSAI